MYDAEEDLLYVGAEPNRLAVPDVSAVDIDVGNPLTGYFPNGDEQFRRC